MYESITYKKPYELPKEVNVLPLSLSKLQIWDRFLIAAYGGEEDGWVRVADTKGVVISKKLYKGSRFVCVRGYGMIPLPANEVRMISF